MSSSLSFHLHAQTSLCSLFSVVQCFARCRHYRKCVSCVVLLQNWDKNLKFKQRDGMWCAIGCDSNGNKKAINSNVPFLTEIKFQFSCLARALKLLILFFLFFLSYFYSNCVYLRIECIADCVVESCRLIFATIFWTDDHFMIRNNDTYS